MKIILPKDSRIDEIVRKVDDSIIQKLIQECFKIKKDDEYIDVYRSFYKTMYPVKDFSRQEQALEGFLTKLATDKPSVMRTKTQHSSYRWVTINKEYIGTTGFRYYFAPNPQNMYEIVKRLTDIFIERNIPVKFKYQLQDKMDECDRIILYSDFEHQKDIEEAILSVYQQNPKLFEGSERGLSWIYPSSIPYVYLAPETPGISYGEEFANTMIEAKDTFSYLYGLTSNSHIELYGEDKEKALKYMDMIICSLLLRRGLLLSKDGRRIVIKDRIRASYNYKTGILRNYCEDNYGFHSVDFSQSMDGKIVLLNEFYNVSNIQPQKGISVEHLTPKERRRKLYDEMGMYRDEFENEEKNDIQRNK